MKKNTEFIVNKRFRRFDTSWTFEIKPALDGLIHDSSINNDTTWYFNGRNGEMVLGTVSYTYADGETGSTHSTFNDNAASSEQNAPFFEYDSDDTASWDLAHSNNKTRYLSPQDTTFTVLTAKQSVENVIIDTEAPKLIEDYTQYVTVNSAARKFSYIFEEKSSLDFTHFKISIGDDVLYSCDKNNTITYDAEKLKNVKISANDVNKYELAFTLDSTVCTVDYLNKNKIQIEVFDVAGNNAIFTINKEFSEASVDNLLPVIISFHDANPTDRIVKFGSVGEIIVDIYNPNTALWGVYPIAFELDENSIGMIDRNAIDFSHYETEGFVRFKIKNINERGQIIVNGWVHADGEWFGSAKSSTFATATNGPWIKVDERNREYNLQAYIPKVLQNTEFGDFICFIEKFLNTYYLSLSGETNISALEKTARILDFNDARQIEKEYLYKYSNALGNELDLSFQDILDLDLHSVNNTDGFGDTAFEDAVDVYRYIIENLPYYNQLKGTKLGMQMMLRMIGFCVTFVNLWLKKHNDAIIENPVFYEQSQIEDFSEYFVSSYFTVNINSNSDFDTFNKNSDILIRLINSIKPITKVLETIRYNVVINDEDNANYVAQNLNTKNISTLRSYECKYKISNVKARCVINDNNKTISALYVPNITYDNKNVSGILSKLALYNKDDITIKVDGTNGTKVNIENATFTKMDSGILIDINGEYRTKLYTAFKNATHFTITIKYKKGTNYVSAKEE